MINNLTDNVTKLNYAFTKIDSNERSGLVATLNSIKLSPNDKSDSGFNLILNDMIQKAETGKIIFIDLFNKYQKPIYAIRQILSNQSIKNPQDTFNTVS